MEWVRGDPLLDGGEGVFVDSLLGKSYALGNTMRKPIEVIAVDFKTAANIDPDFKGTQGLAHTSLYRVYINKAQPERTVFGRQYLLNHEICHIKLGELGIRLKADQEELYCDFEALVNTPNRYLHKNEAMLKRLILGGLSWTHAAQRYAVVSRICDFLELPLDQPTRERLANYKPHPLKNRGVANLEK